MKHGLGKIDFSDGSNYKGEFYHNDIYGEGIFTFPDKTSIKGKFKANLIDVSTINYKVGENYFDFKSEKITEKDPENDEFYE